MNDVIDNARIGVEVIRALRRAEDQFLGHVRHEHRPARAQCDACGARRIGILGIAFLERSRELHLPRVDVGDRDAPELVAIVDHVHGAPVRDVRHRQLARRSRRVAS